MKKSFYSTHSINNAKVVLYPVDHLRSVTIVVYIKAGSWYEGKKWGKHHLLEHMLFTGTEMFPTEESISEYEEEHALYLDAMTSGSSIRVSMHFPDIYIKEGFTLLSEILFKSSFKEEELMKQKK